LATLTDVVIFPSTLAYLFFNRGIALIGPNRAAPFLHLVPVFGSAMAILLLGEELRVFHLIGYTLVLAGVVIDSRQQGASVGPRRPPCRGQAARTLARKLSTALRSMPDWPSSSRAFASTSDAAAPVAA